MSESKIFTGGEMVNWSNRVRLSSNIVKKSDGKEAVLLDLGGEIYHGLNEVGATMLDILLGADSVQEALVELGEVYQVEESRLRTDLDSLLCSLIEKDIIEWVE